MTTPASEPPKQESQESKSRWWEFYTVRYAMPSIVGFLILFSFKDNLPGLVSLFSSKGDGDIKFFGEVTLFAALGFVYCYVASTPILVMHCCRYNVKGLTNLWGFLGLAILGFIVLVIAYVGWACCTIRYGLAIPILIGSVLILSQYGLLFDLYKNHKEFGKFYRDLDEKRNTLGELKDSYQHLREHGNSSLIVVLEVVLASFLYALIEISKLFGISETEVHWILPITFAIWVSPAAFVWYVGGVILESELTTKYFDKK